MNTKRKAELQRKLSMASVPTPPADLASRIKAQIPESIGAPASPVAWWRGTALGIAASLVVVIVTAFIAIRTLSHAPTEGGGQNAISMARSAAKSITQPKEEGAPAQPAAPAPQVAATSTHETAVAAPATFAPEQPTPGRKKDREQIAMADHAEPANIAEEPPVRVAEAAPAAAAIAPPPAKPLPAAQTADQSITITASAPATPTAAAVKTENQTERALRPAGSTEGGVEGAVAGGVAGGLTAEQRRPSEAKRSAPAAAIALPQSAVARSIAPSVFGISVDPAAMDAVRQAVHNGQTLPDANVEAIVNYFAAAADEPPRRIRLQVEGSPPPVLATPRTRIVRISIDTPQAADGDASIAATDAYLAIVFDPNAVVSHRLIGGSGTLTPSQRIVLKNTSVTALYEIQLRPGVRNRQRVVAATLKYRDGTTRRDAALQGVLRVGDVERAWLDASYRHRLASLGAIWGESLRNANDGADVARRAEELAEQQPRDRKARELADLATASSRRRSSGSTGSGR